jgi:chromosome segregation ATPase
MKSEIAKYKILTEVAKRLESLDSDLKTKEYEYQSKLKVIENLNKMIGEKEEKLSLLFNELEDKELQLRLLTDAKEDYDKILQHYTENTIRLNEVATMAKMAEIQFEDGTATLVNVKDITPSDTSPSTFLQDDKNMKKHRTGVIRRVIWL